jgi:hypothetical protein
MTGPPAKFGRNTQQAIIELLPHPLTGQVGRAIVHFLESGEDAANRVNSALTRILSGSGHMVGIGGK